MSPTTWMLLAVVCALASNMVFSLRPATLGETAGFWSIQVLQLSFAAYFALRGVPGMDAMPAASLMLVVLFLFHAAQNAQRRTVWRTLREAEEPAIRWEDEPAAPRAGEPPDAPAP